MSFDEEVQEMKSVYGNLEERAKKICSLGFYDIDYYHDMYDIGDYQRSDAIYHLGNLKTCLIIKDLYDKGEINSNSENFYDVFMEKVAPELGEECDYQTCYRFENYFLKDIDDLSVAFSREEFKDLEEYLTTYIPLEDTYKEMMDNIRQLNDFPKDEKSEIIGGYVEFLKGLEHTLRTNYLTEALGNNKDVVYLEKSRVVLENIFYADSDNNDHPVIPPDWEEFLNTYEGKENSDDFYDARKRYFEIAAESLKDNEFTHISENEVVRGLVQEGYSTELVAYVVNCSSPSLHFESEENAINVKAIDDILAGKDVIKNVCFGKGFITSERELVQNFVEITKEKFKGYLAEIEAVGDITGSCTEAFKRGIDVLKRYDKEVSPLMTLNEKYKVMTCNDYFNDRLNIVEDVPFISYVMDEDNKIALKLLEENYSKDKVIDVLAKNSPSLAFNLTEARNNAKKITEKAFEKLEANKKQALKENNKEFSKIKSKRKAITRSKNNDGIEL